jgi:imidazolonepropionase-like amidohydrolase
MPGTSAQEIVRLNEAGLGSLEAIAAATTGGAAALGRADLGRLTPGACADLVVVNGRPDEDVRLVASPDNFEFVMKDGEIVK